MDTTTDERYRERDMLADERSPNVHPKTQLDLQTMLNFIYLDHNVLVGIAGLPRWHDAKQEHVAIQRLHVQGIRFVLSAWHMYELAGSLDKENVRGYLDFVDDLNPLWALNPNAVKRFELLRFLAGARESDLRQEIPLAWASTTIDGMWLSYGESGITGATFRSVVSALKADTSFLQEVNEAANLTPSAILTGREAHRDGRMKASERIVDREYFAGLLECAPSDPRVDFLLSNIEGVYRVCPTVGIEDTLSTVRVRDGFTPRASHAADLQHALSGLPYCAAFITDDKGLAENSRVTLKKLRLERCLARRIWEVVDVLG